MSISNKIMLSMSLVSITIISLAMENEIELNKSQPLAIPTKVSSDYSSYLTGISAGFNHVSDYVASSLGSLSTTVMNQISDEAAFKKLGWPLSDQIAREELEKSKVLYERYNKSFKSYDEYFEYANDANAINRRTHYCQRVIWALHKNTIPNHADRPKLALHCLQYHKQVLNDFDKSQFLFFIQKDQEKTKLDTKKVDQELEHLTIVPDDNELLNELLNQTIKQKEEEQKKKLEREKELEKQRELQKQKETEKKKEVQQKNSQK